MKKQIKKITNRQLFFLAIATFFLGGEAESLAAQLVPYRAIYDFELVSAEPQTNIVNADGLAKFEFIEGCDGWTSNEDLFLNLRNTEGESEVFATKTSTWESKNGTLFRFKNAQILGSVDDAPTELAGHAKKDADSAVVFIDSPYRDRLVLDAAILFPTKMVNEVIDAALRGDRFLSRLVFDGSDADTGFQVSVVIGKKNPPLDKQAEPLLRSSWWSMSLAFYSLSNQSEVANFVVEMELYENGIAQNRTINFGDYVVKAVLNRLEALPIAKSNCSR
ncbi:MAG: DUF1849 family protein [Alphaproteobacteria bacterium]|nr:DUF1849 family protein [Alphaproteobacteria bacterium]